AAVPRLTKRTHHVRIEQAKEEAMLTHYIKRALARARYEILPDDSTFYGEIPGFQGVWANAETLEACRQQLAEVLEEWIVMGLSLNHPLPIVDGIDLTVK